VNTSSDGFIRSGVVYNDGIAYTASKDGTVSAIPVKSDGTFDHAKAKSIQVSNESASSTPVIAAGKLYVLSGYINGGGSLDVFNAKTLAKLKSVNIGSYSQSSPLVATAYSTSANGEKVYLYIALNDNKDDIIVIEDSDKLTVPIVSVLYSPGGSQSLNSLIAGTDGTIYFADGGGRLNALGSNKLSYDPVDDVHDVSFDAVGGSLKEEIKSFVNGTTYGTLPVPVRKGYTFRGWYAEKTYKTSITAQTKVQLSANATIYAKWSANTYTLKYNVNGGKALKSKSKHVTFDSMYGKLPMPLPVAKVKKKGIGFAGWFTKVKGGSRVTQSTKVNFTADKTIYAHWGKNQTIKFDPAKGKVSKKSLKVPKGALYGKLPAPKRSGYKFSGWYTKAKGGTKITATSTVKKGIKLYAHWKKK
jgi:uncharacterized repeat protein (TIGR02543 family)